MQGSAPLPSSSAIAGFLQPRLFLNAIRVLFYNGVGQDFAGDPLNLLTRGRCRKALIQREGEVFALADGSDIAKPYLAQSIVDGLALRVQDRCLQRDIDMCLHHPRLYKDRSEPAGSGCLVEAHYPVPASSLDSSSRHQRRL